MLASATRSSGHCSNSLIADRAGSNQFGPALLFGRRMTTGTVSTWLTRRSKLSLTAGALGYVAFVGVIDWFTPRAMVFAIFYLPAVLLATWCAGKISGSVVAVASAFAWLLVGRAVALPGELAFIPFWNASSGLIVFLLVVWLLSALKAATEELEDRVAQRTAELKAEIVHRRQLERSVLEVTDREQERIGHDLHDGLCQHLTATMLASKILLEELAAKDQPEADRARQITEYLSTAISQSRAVARGLDPVKLATNGLMSALEELATNVQSMHRLECSFRPTGTIRLDDHAVAIHLYRIAQEAVNNAVKHARPTHIEITSRQAGHALVLTVEDNGRGIEMTNSSSEGMGLHTMSYRANMIGAVLQIGPRPEGGTVVTVTIPV